MAEFTIAKKQNLVDVCLQVYGTTQQLFKLATDNGLSIDDDVEIGDVLTFDESIGDLRILTRIQRDNLSMINPVVGQTSTEIWTDGVGTPFTDGLGVIFTDL